MKELGIIHFTCSAEKFLHVSIWEIPGILHKLMISPHNFFTKRRDRSFYNVSLVINMVLPHNTLHKATKMLLFKTHYYWFFTSIILREQ